MPTNLYGPGDNYDLESSHVLPALIHKMHAAKSRGLDRVEIWGTGKPRREFLFSVDMADPCALMVHLPAAGFHELLHRPHGVPLYQSGWREDQRIAQPPRARAAGRESSLPHGVERVSADRLLAGLGGEALRAARPPGGRDDGAALRAKLPRHVGEHGARGHRQPLRPRGPAAVAGPHQVRANAG